MNTINSIADLLNEFVKAETEILNKQDIKHPVTIGSMYEGLTEQILERYLFEGLNLQVIKNSFINGCDTEFDVLLVEGDGEKIPYTDRYKYNPSQVIAIIQVKKNLYSKDIKDGYGNLRFIADNYESSTPENFMGRMFRDAFRSTCRKDISAKSSGNLEEFEEHIYRTLKIEAVLPVRILWGYNGFSSEFNFRESFYSYIQENLTTDLENKIGGFGPHNFPSLIICGQYSMIKQNGMPFACPIQNDNWWSFFATSSYNPAKFFLEALWTRLSYKFEQLSMDIFGEDLEIEPVKRFLDCRIQHLEGHSGWEYNYYATSDENLKEYSQTAYWEPAELDEIQNVIINELCRNDINLKTDGDLKAYVTMAGLYKSLDDFLAKLKNTGLVSVENDILKLITDQCGCVIFEGKFYAGENRSGRLTNWVQKKMNEAKRKKSN